MADDLLTLAIQPYEKAIILKKNLEEAGIEVVVETVVARQQSPDSAIVRLRVSGEDLEKALALIEAEPIKSSKKETGVVLIPVDFSDYSRKACAVGFRMAHAFRTSVVILHSYINRYFSGTLPLGSKFRLDKKIAEQFKGKEIKARNQMEAFEAELKNGLISPDLLSAVDYRCEVVEGVPEDAILDYAKAAKPALVVMGTRGKHRKEQDLIGSVTAEVLDSIKFPLLIIPEGICVERCGKRSVLLYCNLERSDLSALDRVMSDYPVGKVVLAHVESNHEKLVNSRMEALQEYCHHQYPGLPFSTQIYEEAGFLETFESALIEHDVDLVVIPNKRRNIFSRLFNPSIAHRILFHTDIPMLSIPVV